MGENEDLQRTIDVAHAQTVRAHKAIIEALGLGAPTLEQQRDLQQIEWRYQFILSRYRKLYAKRLAAPVSAGLDDEPR